MYKMQNYFEMIVLYCIRIFNGERSVYAILHMLKGKKSSQTIQDVHLFGLTNLLGTLPDITRRQLEITVDKLLQSGLLIVLPQNGYYLITSIGQELLQQHVKKYPFPETLNGFRFQNRTQPYWSRLSLLIQTISHIIHKQNRFYPIQRNFQTQTWVKRYLAQNRQNRVEIGRHLFDELSTLLEKRPEKERAIFVKRLTGIHRIGSTYSQISKELHEDEWYVRYLFLGTIHFMLQEFDDSSVQYPYLYSIIKDIQGNSHTQLTNSTQMTLKYLQTGKSLEEIAFIRRLKRSTIEDHIVELAYSDPLFNISRFMSQKIEEVIRIASKTSRTKQLRAIKEIVANDEISFFQIRLVLAKAGDDQ
ncbi:helix-turn-helix domain-containing protein [Peribacillus loiseleuriae]|nr:helix-turn-helix domain-containing protein [Peribacillus loiseleuriae]